MKNKAKIASLILRCGLAFVFAYAVFSFYIDPTTWIGYFPDFMRVLLPEYVLTYGFAVYEIILTIWLLSNRKIFMAAVLSTLTLFGIIIFNLDHFNILFRNVAIFCSAVALAVLSVHRGMHTARTINQKQNTLF